MVRSRVRWHEEGERNTKYFLNLEKRNFSSTHISRVKTREGNETTNAEEILSMQKRFYEQLYAQVPCTNEDGDAFFNNPDLVRLSENDQRILEQPLTEKECLEVHQCSSRGGWTAVHKASRGKMFGLSFTLGRQTVQSSSMYALQPQEAPCPHTN